MRLTLHLSDGNSSRVIPGVGEEGGSPGIVKYILSERDTLVEGHSGGAFHHLTIEVGLIDLAEALSV